MRFGNSRISALISERPSESSTVYVYTKTGIEICVITQSLWVWVISYISNVLLTTQTVVRSTLKRLLVCRNCFYLILKVFEKRCVLSSYLRLAFMYYYRMDLTNMQMTCNYYLTWKTYRYDPILDSSGRRVILQPSLSVFESRVESHRKNVS